MRGLFAALGAVKEARWLEIRDVGEAQLALFRAQAMRWVRPLGQLVALSDERSAALTTSQREVGERFATAINRAARYGMFRPKCLARAVALSQLLDAHGIIGHCIRIGVRCAEGTFTAHAWVELGASIMGDNERSTSSYVPLTKARVVVGKHQVRAYRSATVEPSLPDGRSMWDQ